MKKQFTTPLVFLMAGINGVGDGHGSNQDEFNSIKPVPMSFAEWAQSRFVSDYDQNPGVDFQDYTAWFSQCGFGETAWMQLNPGATMEVTETK
jgi:hypothetical protein